MACRHNKEETALNGVMALQKFIETALHNLNMVERDLSREDMSASSIIATELSTLRTMLYQAKEHANTLERFFND